MTNEERIAMLTEAVKQLQRAIRNDGETTTLQKWNKRLRDADQYAEKVLAAVTLTPAQIPDEKRPQGIDW